MSGRYNLRVRNRGGAQTTPATENTPELRRRISDIFLPGRRNRQAEREEQPKKGDDESRGGSLKRKPSLSSSLDSSDSELSRADPPKRARTSVMGFIRDNTMTKAGRKKKEEKEKQKKREQKEKRRSKRRPATAEEVEARVAEICTDTWWAETAKVMEDFQEEYQYFLRSNSGPPSYNPSVVAPMYAQWEDGRDGWICRPPFMIDEVPPTDEIPYPTYYTEGWWEKGDGHLGSDKNPDPKTGPKGSRSEGSSSSNVTRVTEGEVDVEMSGANETEDGRDSNEKSRSSKDKWLIKPAKPGRSKIQIVLRSVTQKESERDNSDNESVSVSSQLRRLSLKKQSAAPKSRKRLNYPKQNPPILMHEDVPPEWNWDHNDDDLAEDDIEGNIARCHKRIKTGIIPQIWKMKLRRYEAMKEQHDAMMATEPKGLSVFVVKRLKDLEAIAKGLETWMEDVSDHHLKNVHGVIDAYRTGKLGWEQGKIVCFYKGKPLGTWKVMSLEEVNKVCLAHENQVWVEGLSGPGPATHGFAGTTVIENESLPDRPTRHFVPTLLGIRGHNNRSRMRFRDDTAADFTTMFMEDVDTLRAGVDTSKHDVIQYGFVHNQSVSGKFISWVIGLEIKILDDATAANHMTSFKVQPFTIMPRGHAARTGFSDRLCGPWWRSALYTASAPDNNHRIYVSQTKKGLGNLLPDVNYNNARKQQPPHFVLEQGLEQEYLAQENEPADKGVGDPMDTEP